MGNIDDKPMNIQDDNMVNVKVVSKKACKIREKKLSVDRENPVDSAKKYENGIKMKHKFEKMNIQCHSCLISLSFSHLNSGY